MSISDFSTSYEISPIMLIGGVALNTPGGNAIPIVTLLQAQATFQAFNQGLSNNLTLSSDPFAFFIPPPGGTLIDNDIAHWPLANQATAANAVISKPLRIALRMICPGGKVVSYTGKQAVMTALQSTLAQHIGAGGWFSVATPSFIYTTCLLTSLTDVSEQVEGGQVQVIYEWQFEQPIITDQQATTVMNQAMAKISSGTKVTGDPPAADPISNTVGVAYPPVATGLNPNIRPLKAAGAAAYSLTTPFSPYPKQSTDIGPLTTIGQSLLGGGR
jgi:hypothetical protein